MAANKKGTSAKAAKAASKVLRDGRTVLWGSADESALKAEVLVALLDGPGRTFDVSVPGQPTFKP